MTAAFDCAASGGSGVLMRAAGGARLGDVDEPAVQRLFGAHGLVLLRGFAPTAADVETFSARFSSERLPGTGKRPFPELAHLYTANESMQALEPHIDHGTRAEHLRPQITWFFCETPAERDGETTLFDGVRVWQRLTAATRALLEATRISFLSSYGAPAWRQLGFADAESFARFTVSVGARPSPPRADGTVDVEQLTRPMLRTRTGEPAFVSSLCVAGSPGFELMKVTLEGGAPIPVEIMTDIRAALAACRELIRWEARDLALLDNSRFLHGRRAYDDRRRKLYLLQTLRANF
jgi:alpha-ketoglutarate-dependent taurine dioxygenase